MLQKGVKLSAGTDATRVASYNPWVSLAWLVTGRTVGGLRIYPQRSCLDRETALRMWAENVTWFSNEEGKKGRMEAGQLADLIVPDRDNFACADSEITDTGSELTMVGGRIVYAAGVFASLYAPPPPAMPNWSPVRRFGGYAAWGEQGRERLQRQPLDETCGCANACSVHGHNHSRAWTGAVPAYDLKSFWGALGCSCFAFWDLRDAPSAPHDSRAGRPAHLFLRAPATATAAHILLCLPFWWSGLSKLLDFSGGTAEMAALGLEPSSSGILAAHAQGRLWHIASVDRWRVSNHCDPRRSSDLITRYPPTRRRSYIS